MPDASRSKSHPRRGLAGSDFEPSHDGYTALWRKRAIAYWREAAIYGSYAMRSGLAGLLMLAFIAGSYLYLRALQATPPDFPYWRVTTPILALAIGAGRVRTFLKGADTVFLAPAEATLAGYWRRSLAYSFGLQALGVLAALLAVWPLYAHVKGNDALPFPAALAAALVLRGLALGLRSREAALLHRSHRIAVALLRWVGAVVAGFTLLAEPLLMTGAATLAFGLAALAALRLSPRTAGVPWIRLIAQERALMRRRYLQFSWFADVPQLAANPKQRRMFAKLLQLIPFEQRQSYFYLYMATFLRSEAFGILLRLTTASVFILAVSEPLVVQALVYSIALLLASATATSLDQAHRYSFWLDLYPASKKLRTRAIMRAGGLAVAGLNTFMGAGLLLLAVLLQRSVIEALLFLAAGYLWSLFFAWVPLRRRALKLENSSEW